MKARKSGHGGLPEHLKAILKDVGVRAADATSAETALQQRAAAQVRDYLHIMTMKLSRFAGPRASSPVAALAEILDAAAQETASKRARHAQP